jgi:hypothetical protein
MERFWLFSVFPLSNSCCCRSSGFVVQSILFEIFERIRIMSLVRIEWRLIKSVDSWIINELTARLGKVPK